jgi:hypothetical protein
LAAEKLSELHGMDLGVETLRQWMIDAGLWVRRKDRLKRIHQPRARRDCLGELVQIDGSEHWWFEDRGLQARSSTRRKWRRMRARDNQALRPDERAAYTRRGRAD